MTLPVSRPRATRRGVPLRRSARPAFTLVEILVAAVLTLLMMLTVVTVFASVSDSIRGSRSTVEMADSLRHTKDRLQADLAGVTVTMLPPRRPEQGEGYFEYIEGPVGTALPLVLRTPPPSPTLQFAFEYDLPDGNSQWDSTVGDNDDILMFTTRSLGEPFVGRFGVGTTVESQVAEVAWFVRGTTLYRRVLLVAPRFQAALPAPGAGYYANFDLSVRQEGGNLSRMAGAGGPELVLNTLGDLTKRENRYAHQPHVFPHDARFWGPLGLPTLRESSAPAWPFPLTNQTDTHVDAFNYDNSDTKSQLIVPLDEEGDPLALQGALHPTLRLDTAVRGDFDAWENPRPWDATDPVSGELLTYSDSSRAAEDVILTNVLAFDVKAWDPGAPILQAPAPDGRAVMPGDPAYVDLAEAFFTNPATIVLGYGAYVDLNYMQGRDIDYSNYDGRTNIPKSYFYGPGDPRSQLMGHHDSLGLNTGILAAAVYDTGSFHYEHDGFNQNRHFDTTDWYNYNLSTDNIDIDEGTDGFDNNSNGMVDDDGELEAPPPYRVPLRGIQVKIRVFDPSSRQVREVTVVQDFTSQ